MKRPLSDARNHSSGCHGTDDPLRRRRRTSHVIVRLPPAAAGMRIGLLGGSFNPPHGGHRMISLEALKRLALDRIWWLVSPGNPLKSHADLAPLEERLRAARALADHPRIIPTAFEAALGSPFSINTLGFLLRRFPTVRFVWLMGADNLAEFHRWRDWRAIFESAPIAVLDRPGWRYRALASPAAHAFEYGRLDEGHAAALASRPPPAWLYLSGKLSPLSSREIRAAKR